jgi:uncharacterized delta-60 repeat protein
MSLPHSLRRVLTISLAAAAVCVWASPPAAAAGGELDGSFSLDGKVDQSIAGVAGPVGLAVAQQASGRIVMVGSGDPSGGSTDQDWVIARFTTDGELDTLFGGGDGVSTTAFTARPGASAEDIARAVAVTPGGNKFAVAGQAGTNFGVARYSGTGALDTAFSGDGKTSLDFDLGTDAAFAVVVQSNGKIVAGGNTAQGTKSSFALARFNADGTADTTFDGDGRLTTVFGANEAGINGLAIAPGGKIVAEGYSGDDIGNHRDFAVARYNSNGSLDQTFSGDGKLTFAFGSGNDIGVSVLVQPSDSRIVVAGTTYSGSNTKLAVARILTGGTFDDTFDFDGKVTIQFTLGENIGGHAGIASDGKIVVAGYTYTNAGGHDFAVARLTTGGSYDPTFSGDGRVTTSITRSSTDFAYSALVQPDDWIVVAGSEGSRFALTRYLAS